VKIEEFEIPELDAEKSKFTNELSEIAHTSKQGSKRKGKSPERVIKGPGADYEIQQLRVYNSSLGNKTI